MLESKIYPTLELQETIANNRLISLWRLLKGFRLAYIGAVLALAIATIAKTTTYILLRYFVDDVLTAPTPPVPYYLIAVGFVGLAIIEGSFTFFSGRLAAHSSEGLTLRLRNYLYDHLQRLPVAYHDKTQTGELVQRCSSDVDALRRFFAEQAIGVGRLFLLFAINFIALLMLHVELALMTIMVIPAILAFSLFFFRKIYVAYEAHQDEEGKLSALLQENLSGVRVVKAFARQSYEIDKFEATNWQQYQKGRTLVTRHAMFWPTNETMCYLQYILVMYVGAVMVMNNELTLGTYLAFLGMAIWIIFPMQNLGRLVVQLSEGVVSYQRVAEIIAESKESAVLSSTLPSNTHQATVTNGHYTNGHHKPDNGHNGYSKHGQPSLYKNGASSVQNGTIKGHVRFNQVSLAYNDETTVLHNISFTAEPGQTIALLGPTGSGKSSVINLLTRFYDYTSGEILLDDQPITDYPLPTLRQQIGVVEQEPFLFSRTIRENIAYGVDHAVTDEEVITAAKAAAIHEVILTFPDGYNTLVGEKGVTLSGGQKQRIAIARTLLKSPTILIFDDAVSAVDTETEQYIHNALEELRHGRTTFIIAHRIQTVMRADKILVLDNGEIVQQGQHHELMAQAGIYRQIYDLQSQIDSEVDAG